MSNRETVENFASMTVTELQETIEDMKDDLFRLNMQLASGTLERTSRIKEVRRDIARAKTVLREYQLGIRQSPGAAIQEKESE